jgi:hypothetical protein
MFVPVILIISDSICLVLMLSILIEQWKVSYVEYKCHASYDRIFHLKMTSVGEVIDAIKVISWS